MWIAFRVQQAGGSGRCSAYTPSGTTCGKSLPRATEEAGPGESLSAGLRWFPAIHLGCSAVLPPAGSRSRSQLWPNGLASGEFPLARCTTSCRNWRGLNWGDLRPKFDRFGVAPLLLVRGSSPDRYSRGTLPRRIPARRLYFSSPVAGQGGLVSKSSPLTQWRGRR